jgi:hypothetical protein
MSNVSALLTYIYQKLAALSEMQVFQDKVPSPEEQTEPVAYPYIVFSLTIPERVAEQDRGILEIDFWTDDGDISTLESLVSAVDGNSNKENPTGLNEHKYFSDDLQAVFYRVFRGAVPDPDPVIRRRQLRYLVKTRYIND